MAMMWTNLGNKGDVSKIGKAQLSKCFNSCLIIQKKNSSLIGEIDISQNFEEIYHPGME